MRIITCGLMLGIFAACSGAAHADDNVATEIQSLKAKLKELQQRVDSEARKTQQVEAQAKAAPAMAVVRFRLCGCRFLFLWSPRFCSAQCIFAARHISPVQSSPHRSPHHPPQGLSRS